MLIIEPAADGRLHLRNNQRSGYARDVGSARSLATDWGHTEISIRSALARMGAAGSEGQGAWKVRSERDERRDAPARGEAGTDRKPVDPRPLKQPRTPVTTTAAVAAAPPSQNAPKRPRARREAVVAPAVAASARAENSHGPAGSPRARSSAQAPAERKAVRKTPERPVKPTRGPASPVRATPKAATKTAPSTGKKSTAAAPSSRATTRESPRAPGKRKIEGDAAGGIARKARSAKRAETPATTPKTPRRAGAEAPSAQRAARLFREGVREIAAIEAATIPFAREPWTRLREMAEQIAASLEGRAPRRS